MTSQFRFKNVTISGLYEHNFEGDAATNSAMTADVTAGEEIVQALSTYCDYSIKLDTNLCPTGIRSWDCQVNYVSLDQATNLDNSKYNTVYKAAMRKALSQEIEKTLETNVKVCFNLAIQETC